MRDELDSRGGKLQHKDGDRLRQTEGRKKRKAQRELWHCCFRKKGEKRGQEMDDAAELRRQLLKTKAIP